MMSKFTLLKVALFTFFLSGMRTASAETYPVYLAGGGVVTLAPQGTINPGDKTVWVETTGGTTNIVKPETDASLNFTTPADLTVGVHTYTVHIVSANPANCIGDPSVEFKLYVLPPTTIALSNPSLALYCTNATVPASDITATATPAQALPEAVSYEYTWFASKDGAAAVNGTTVGLVSAGSTILTSDFKLYTTANGQYAITAHKRALPASPV